VNIANIIRLPTQSCKSSTVPREVLQEVVPPAASPVPVETQELRLMMDQVSKRSTRYGVIRRCVAVGAEDPDLKIRSNWIPHVICIH
jgi:hypothetical protein